MAFEPESTLRYRSVVVIRVRNQDNLQFDELFLTIFLHSGIIMKLTIAFASLAGFAAANPFAAKSVRSAKANYNAALMKNARRLNDNQNNVDISTYAVMFEKCQFIKSYSDTLAENAAYDTVLATDRFVIFKLCPDSACSTCTTNYGEYMVDLDTYLQATVEYEKQNQEEMCNECNNCAAADEADAANADNAKADNADNANADNANADAANGGRKLVTVDCTTCAADCEKIANMETNGYIDATNFLECQMIYDPADGSGAALYAGPVCASSGSKINIGVFTDQYCFVADESKSVDDYLVDANGYSMKLSHALLKSVYASTCISCAKEENGDGNNQANDMCKTLYEEAAKCETSHGFNSGFADNGGYDNQVSQEAVVCDFIKSVSKGAYDSSGEISIYGANSKSGASATTGGQKFALSFFVIGTVALAAYAAMLHTKLTKGGKAGLSNQGGAMA
jgi:hypothetical protein